MFEIIEFMERILGNIVQFTILLFEFVGVGVIIWTGIRSFIKLVTRSHDLAVYLAKGLCLGLEFKMGGEILRTVVVRTWQEIGIVAGIIVLRSALSILLHWEIREEEKAKAGAPEKKSEGTA